MYVEISILHLYLLPLSFFYGIPFSASFICPFCHNPTLSCPLHKNSSDDCHLQYTVSKSEVQYHIHKRPSLFPILMWINRVQYLPFYLLYIHVILASPTHPSKPRSFKGFLFFNFSYRQFL